jgi:hypothetical protein
MRTKTLIHGFKNSQPVRVIIDGLGLYMTIAQIETQFATTPHRVAVWLTAERLAGDRAATTGKLPTSIAHRIRVDNRDYDVQLDLL